MTYLMMCFQQSSACDPSSKASCMTTSIARTEDKLTAVEAEKPALRLAPVSVAEQSSCDRGDKTSPTRSCSCNLLHRRVEVSKHLF